MSTKPNVVILWVHPRSTSTMFEMALLNRQDEFRVLHEPMGSAWYFGPQRQAPRFSQEEIDKKYPQFKESTYPHEWHDVVTSPEGKRTFSKDMAQYIFTPRKNTGIPVDWNKDPANPTLIPTEDLVNSNIHHTFLIRKPEKAVPSYYRLCSGDQCDITDFQYYDPDEAGYYELRKLFDFIKEKQGKTPFIIDSDDLIKDPKYFFRKWCEDSGVDYSDSFLEWGKGARDHFAKWPGFHTAAEQSQGIGREDASHKNTIVREDLPDIAKQAIINNQDDYKYLKGFTIPASSSSENT